MKPNENAAREYAEKNLHHNGTIVIAHLSGQQHILDTLAEMAREHAEAIEVESIKSATIDGKHIVGFDWQFTQGAHFGFTLVKASMQGEMDEYKNALEKVQLHRDNIAARASACDAEILRLTEMVEMMEKSHIKINNEPSARHWKFNDDGTTSNTFAVFAREKSHEALTKISEIRKKL